MEKTMGFKFEKGQPYIMPAHFGPATQGWDGKVAHYEDNTAIAILYTTERKAISALLPPGFVATDPPLVSVNFVMCRGVNFMAGGGYNLVAINVSVDFEGKKDKLSGNFALVLWENSFAPIVVGREVLGAPKLMAEIPDAWIRDGKRGFSISENGALLLEGEVSNLQKLSDDALKELAAQAAAATWMSWKYVPSCDLRGADISTATALPAKAVFREAWMGQGQVNFHSVQWEHAPLSYRIINALKELPIVDYQGAVLTRLSQDLLIHQQRYIQ
jgi:acetoacetate decarboxylase